MKNNFTQQPETFISEIQDTATLMPWVDAELRISGIDARMIALLKAIDESGSINQAAKQVGLSYKGAWQIIERANNLAPKLLVATVTGGSKGGGTRLTAAGLTLLNLFSTVERKHRQFLQDLNLSLAENADLLLMRKRLDIKTSADNLLFGTISDIRLGRVNAEVFVSQKGGQQIVATIDRETLSQLDLSMDTDAVMLINSSDVILTTESDTGVLSARNKLLGMIIRTHLDAVNTQVAIRLNGGDTFIVTITQQSAANLRLKPGMEVCAVFKSNAVMLGVADE